MTILGHTQACPTRFLAQKTFVIGTEWLGPFPKHKVGQVVGFHWNFSISITSLAFRRQHEGKIAPRRKKSTIEMDPFTSVRRPLQDVTNGCVPLPLGLPCAMAQPCLSPSPPAMPQAAVVAHLEPQHQQTAALSTAVVSVQAQSATGAWQREGLSSAAVVDALQG